MTELYRIDHYENFPVASVLLPRRLRAPISVIYTFARRADDFADEGDWPPEHRLEQLRAFRSELARLEAGQQPESKLFEDLGSVIRNHDLPFTPFYDLLDAFSQDVTKKRYAHFGEVMAYCRRSANPVGRLLLHLYGQATPRNLAYSDAICSSLQLINFLQDVAIDYQKDRVYLPEDEMNRFGITERQIAEGRRDGAWQPFMRFQIDRARRLLQSGAPLGKILGGRIGLEMRLIIMGGETILRKLHRSGGDVFQNRPVLLLRDWLYMAYRAILIR